ncbi:MAG: DUF1573 domain-containing protein [Gemmataceae bacterium]
MSRLLLGFVFGLMMVGSASAGANDYFSEFVRDFGVTPRGPVLVHYFSIKNTTNTTVQIGQPRVSCGCVAANVLKNTLAPGESTAVVANMDTRRIPQSNVIKAVTVYVPFLSPTLEEVSLRVQSIARDDLLISPEGLAFGTVRKGQPATAKVKVTILNDANVKITEAKSTGVYIGAEAKALPKLGNEASFEVIATLDAKTPDGVWTADVWLTTTNPGMAKVRIPVNVTVMSPLAVNPEVVKLAEVRLGDNVEHKVTLRGNQAFKVLQVKGGDEQVLVTTQGETAQPVHVLNFAVKPTATGDLIRTIEVTTDLKDQAKVSIPFSVKVTKP